MGIRHSGQVFVALVVLGAGHSLAVDANEPTCLIKEAEWCEVRAVASDLGMDYVQIVSGAAQGDLACLRHLLRFTTTQEMNDHVESCETARYTHKIVLSKLLTRVGDRKFALAVSLESDRMRAAVLKDLDWRKDYLARWYPRTAGAFGIKDKSRAVTR